MSNDWVISDKAKAEYDELKRRLAEAEAERDDFRDRLDQAERESQDNVERAGVAEQRAERLVEALERIALLDIPDCELCAEAGNIARCYICLT